MRVRFVEIYEFRGVTRLSSNVNFGILHNASFGAKVVDSITEEFDLLAVKQAYIAISMRSFTKRHQLKDREKYLQRKIAELRRKRRKEFKSGTFLIFYILAEIPCPPAEKRISAGRYNFYLNAFDKESIRKKFQESIHACLSSVLISTNETSSLNIKKVGDYTFVASGKDNPPTLLINVHVFGKGIIGSSLPNDASILVPLFYKEISEKVIFKSAIENFLLAALNEANDEKAFVHAWLALEKLFSKLFKYYYQEKWEKESDSKLISRVKQQASDYDRIAKRKYKLRDMFLIVGSYLNREDFEQDYEEFSLFNDLRIKTYHKKGLAQETPPIDEMKRFFKKYVKLHLARGNLASF